MGASKVDPDVILDICERAKTGDPYDYFWKAVLTEMEHGDVGKIIGTNVIRTHKQAAKIAIAHLMGVEAGKSRSQWVVFPTYYVKLWESEQAFNKRVNYWRKRWE